MYKNFFKGKFLQWHFLSWQELKHEWHLKPAMEGISMLEVQVRLCTDT